MLTLLTLCWLRTAQLPCAAAKCAVTGLQETPELLLVMLGETLAIVVPKRGQADATLDALRAAVRNRPGAAATGL